MLIRRKGHFVRGVLMLASFITVCFFLLTPMLHDRYGNHLTGLQYADAVFNSLAKGSSYFIPQVRENVKKVSGKNVELSVPVKRELANITLRILASTGIEARIEENRLFLKGSLESMLEAAIFVGDRLYYNEHKPVEERFRAPALLVAKSWWYTLHPAIKELQKQGLIQEAAVVDDVLRRALEPGNNFYSVPVSMVRDNILLITAMLVFYLVYTLWYGFGIFALFEGIGLSMSKKH